MSRACLILLDCELCPTVTRLEVMVKTWLMDDRFAPLLQKNASTEDPSRVIITASVAGIGIGSLGSNATFGYSASKAAAIHLAKNLAVELGPRGILVNAIAPGFFPSKMANGLLELSGGLEATARKNPSLRLGRPEDLAGAVVFLSSRAASHINGATLVIDGGEVLARGGMVHLEKDATDKKQLPSKL